MEKYKVCPVCGTHNNPLFLECSDCESDLQNVPVVDEEIERAVAQNAGQVIEANLISAMVRVCDCGSKNPVQARRCFSCGEDISMIIPKQDTEATTDNTVVQQYLLSSLDGAYTYKIKEGTTIIGREYEMQEYLSSKPYVSRKHAELILDSAASVLTIKNCNTMNYTFVNNQMISGDITTELKNGDEIGLGGNEQNGSRQEKAAYFLVRVGSCM